MSRGGKVAERLTAAGESATLVRIERSPRNSDRVDGFVLSVGSKWVLMSQTGDGGYFDGLVAVRLKDLVNVEDDSTFASRFARTQPEWPPVAPTGLNLDSTGRLIESLSKVTPLIGIEQERRYKSAMRWIGVVDEIQEGWLWLHQVRPDATWHEQPLGYKLRRITEVTISDRYLIALALVAGRAP